MNRRMHHLEKLFADSGYAGQKLEDALIEEAAPPLEIVRRPKDAEGFVLLPRRWVVERFFASFGRYRRLDKYHERRIETAHACLYLASINRIIRR